MVTRVECYCGAVFWVSPSERLVATVVSDGCRPHCRSHQVVPR